MARINDILNLNLKNHISMDILRLIRQGGMGVYIGTPFLAKSVSLKGGNGTVSGALADQVLVRALQIGDPGGHFRRALSHFPYPRFSNWIIEKYYVFGGEQGILKIAPKMKLNPSNESIALTICANFALVYLAKEGHNNPIAINYLEKIQMPIVYALVGAMLAGVDCVTVGAGIPRQIPSLLDKISRGEEVLSYNVDVIGSETKTIAQVFDIRKFFGNKLPEMKRPDFIPIVSSHVLAQDLLNRSNSTIEGFVVETHTAGGHNAPPRGGIKIGSNGEPIYGERDKPNLEGFKLLGLPFWIAGGYASPEALQDALSKGASGVQLGSIFALCNESGMRKDVRQSLISQLYYNEASVFTNHRASPTGFPFKVVDVEESAAALYFMEKRIRMCDMGALLKPCQMPDSSIKYRCSAEPLLSYAKKGGKESETHGVYCLCNGLLDNSELNHNGGGNALVTLGSDTTFLKRIINQTGSGNYSVDHVMNYMGVR